MGSGVSGIGGEVVEECGSAIIMADIWVRVRVL